MRRIFFFILAFCALFISACKTNERAPEAVNADSTLYHEPHRPQVHFSPPSNWMNDPNGMYYEDGVYHLFYQHYPDSNVWGPMHWGHATSRDLVKWENQPIALYPDSLGYIFSGSAVVDHNNTSGFGSEGNPPVVAMYTYHDAEMEKAGKIDYQTQAIAYSTDNGNTWTKHSGNPVMKNPGIRDFRDPKVIWHEPSRKWIVALAVQDHIEFWSSPDLKTWEKLSEFGKEYGGHGGVWECPELMHLRNESGQERWVLLVSINPGGPNGGSATQYFTGTFDGKTFMTEMEKSETKWIDHGPDNYAGVTFNNAPEGRLIFMGWMNNWAYGQVIPTRAWRGAATAPRDLGLTEINGKMYLASAVSPEYVAAGTPSELIHNVTVERSLNVSKDNTVDVSTAVIRGQIEAKSFALEFSNGRNQKVVIGFDAEQKQFYIDRSASGNTGFSSAFNGRSTAPRIATTESMRFEIVTDVSSIEVLFDNGVTAMTAIYFPDEPLRQLSVTSPSTIELKELEVHGLSPIW